MRGISLHGWWVALACVGLGGCPKSATTEQGAGDNVNTTSADGSSNPRSNTDGASAGSTADAGSVANAGGGASAGGRAAAFAGTYSVTVGTLYVPGDKDWASVKFKNDDKQMLGDGVITIAMDDGGRVSGGTESGPLGASLLEGTSGGGTLSATVRRKDPADNGLTGTLVAKVTADAIVGSMNLAEGNAAVVRRATVSMSRK